MDLRTVVVLLPTPSAGNFLPTPGATDTGGPRAVPEHRTSGGADHGPRLRDVAAEPGCWGDYAPAVARWEHITDQPTPPPTEPGVLNRSRVRQCAHETGMDGWAATAAIRAGLWGARLSPRFSEWLMGLPPGWVTATPGVSRSGALTAIGNGQVPQCAAAALRALLGPVGESDAA